MDSKATLEQLKKARAAIDKAILAIEADVVSVDDGAPRCVLRGESLAGKKVVRGLCPACYSLLKKRVDNGEDTWQSLEAEGKALPESKSGRKPIDLAKQEAKDDVAKIAGEANVGSTKKPVKKRTQ